MSLRLFFAISLTLSASISSFSQMVPPERAGLIETGQLGDMGSSKTIDTRAAEVVGSLDPLLPWQEEVFDRTGMTRLWQKRGTAISRIRGAKVVIMGTGVDASHPDLMGRVDCAASQTFIEGGGDPCRDEWGHDTAVATIGFANGEDGIGMRGFAWNTRILSYKVMTTELNEFGQARLKVSPDALIRASRQIRELADSEEAVIVITAFVYNSTDPVLMEVFEDLKNKGNVYVVASSDNIRFLNSETQPGLPCFASTLSNVDCTASLTIKGELAGWSSYGKRISQTGRCDNIVAGYPGGRYGNFLGNSGCAPQVAALASLVWGYAKERGVTLFAAELKMLMQRGATFAPGLISAIVQYEVANPHTLDAERLFEVVDMYIAGGLEPLAEGALRVSGVKSGDFGVVTELKVGEHYAIAGQGFGEEYALFINGVRVSHIYSGDIAEFTLGPEAYFFTQRGGNNVLYFTQVDREGRVCPFSVTKVLSGFQIR